MPYINIDTEDYHVEESDRLNVHGIGWAITRLNWSELQGMAEDLEVEAEELWGWAKDMAAVSEEE